MFTLPLVTRWGIFDGYREEILLDWCFRPYSEAPEMKGRNSVKEA
jgi:hypothetical protein